MLKIYLVFQKPAKKYSKTLVLHRLKDLYAKRKNTLGWICVSVLLSACGIMLLLSVKRHELAELPPPQTDRNRSLGNYSIYPVSQWGGLAVNATELNPLPVGLLVVDHTMTKTCAGFDECSSIMRSLQHFEMTVEDMTDVCENFYVSGNGDVYVGRGWDAKNCLTSEINIGVSFIGDFNKDRLNKEMKKSFLLLLRRGVSLSKLASDYLMVGHNQTVFAEGPGKNVYSFIKTLPNFSGVDLRHGYKDLYTLYSISPALDCWNYILAVIRNFL